MAHCTQCGSAVRGAARFCENCGAPLETVPTSPPRGLRRVSAATYGVALMCFLLPFIAVSCGGTTVASFTGIQLVTGVTVETPSVSGSGGTRRAGPEGLAIVAFLAGVVGVWLGLSQRGQGSAAAAAAGIAGGLSLLFLKSKVNGEILRETGGLLHVEYETGYWIAFALYILGALLNAFGILQGSGRSESEG